MKVKNADRREAAAVLRRLADAVDRGEIEASALFVAGIVGALATLDPVGSVKR